LLYVLAVVIGSTMSILSVYWLIKYIFCPLMKNREERDDGFFLLNVSGYSLGILMCWDFQLFGFNMMLGLAIDSAYFEY
jgi:hypothetical protein